MKRVAGVRAVTALEEAARKGDLKRVNELLDKPGGREGAAAHHNAALRCAARNGHLAVVELLLEIEAVKEEEAAEGNRALSEVVEGGHLAIAKRLLEVPVVLKNVAAEHHRALGRAVEGGHEAVLYLLIKAYQTSGIELPSYIRIKDMSLSEFVKNYQERLDGVRDNFLELLPIDLTEIIEEYALILLDRINRRGKDEGHIKKEEIITIPKEELVLKENEKPKESALGVPYPVRQMGGISTSARSGTTFTYKMSDETEENFSEEQPLGPIEVKIEQEKLEQIRPFPVYQEQRDLCKDSVTDNETVQKHTLTSVSTSIQPPTPIQELYCTLHLINSLRNKSTEEDRAKVEQAILRIEELQKSNYFKLNETIIPKIDKVLGEEVGFILKGHVCLERVVSILSQKPSTPNIESSSTSVEKIEIPTEEQRKIDKESGSLDLTLTCGKIEDPQNDVLPLPMHFAYNTSRASKGLKRSGSEPSLTDKRTVLKKS